MRYHRNLIMSKLSLSILLSLVFLCSVAYAHKVNTYAYREGDKISGECYFVDGSPCKNSRIEVYNLQGKKILETSTDEKGKYFFVLSGKENLKIIAYAGEGHRAEFTLEEIKTPSEDVGNKLKNKIQIYHNSNPSSNEEQIKQMIDYTLTPKLEELRSEIREMRKQMDRVNLRDIIGGIGYIVGIWGIIMLIRRRKNAS